MYSSIIIYKKSNDKNNFLNIKEKKLLFIGPLKNYARNTKITERTVTTSKYESRFPEIYPDGKTNKK